VLKDKLDIVLSSGLIEKVKNKSIKEKRSISEIIEEALKRYLDDSRIRLEAFRQFTKSKSALTREEVDELLNQDYYNQ
jgi:NifU-like protein involved in Fe-S cluster formation